MIIGVILQLSESFRLYCSIRSGELGKRAAMVHCLEENFLVIVLDMNNLQIIVIVNLFGSSTEEEESTSNTRNSILYISRNLEFSSLRISSNAFSFESFWGYLLAVSMVQFCAQVCCGDAV